MNPRAVLLFSLCMAACQHGDGSPAVATVRDSAGVRVVEHPEGSLDRIPTWSVIDTIWSLVGRPDVAHEVPSSVTDAILIDTTHVAVLSALDHAAYVFSTNGGVPLVVGREGDGPGEFRKAIQVLYWSEGKFAVWDDVTAAVTVFNLSGSVADRIRLPAQFTIQRGQKLVGRTADAGIVAPLTPLEAEVMGNREHPVTRGLHQDSLHLRLFRPGAPAPSELTALEGVDRVGTGKGRFDDEGPPLLGREPFTTIAAGVLVVSAADRFEIRYLVGPATAQMVRAVFQPPLASRVQKDLAIDRWSDEVHARPALFRRPGDDDPSRLTIRDTLPVFAGIVGEVSGAVWFALYDRGSPNRIWFRLGPKGELLGKVTLGAECEILDASFPFLLVRVPEDYGLKSLLVLRVGEDPVE